MDILARIFPLRWIALILFLTATAFVYGHWDAALIVLVGVPLVRGAVLLLVERWQASHYAALAGDPAYHHDGWHYRLAPEPLAERWGRRCARCDARLTRGGRLIEGVAPLRRRPRIGQPEGLHWRAPKGTPLWASFPYCERCGAELTAAGSAQPPPAESLVITAPPARRLPWTPVVGAGLGGVILILVLVSRNPCEGPACPCLRAWNDSGEHESLATLRQLYSTAEYSSAVDSAQVGRYAGPPASLPGATGGTVRISAGTCVVVPPLLRVFALHGGSWDGAHVKPGTSREDFARGDFTTATIVTDGTLRQQ